MVTSKNPQPQEPKKLPPVLFYTEYDESKLDDILFRGELPASETGMRFTPKLVGEPGKEGYAFIYREDVLRNTYAATEAEGGVLVVTGKAIELKDCTAVLTTVAALDRFGDAMIRAGRE